MSKIDDFIWRISLRNCFRNAQPVEIACICLFLGQILVLLTVSLQNTIPLERLFRDTIAVAEDYPGCCHVYDGMMSNLGILMWWSTASVSALAFLILKQQKQDLRTAGSFGLAAVLTGWLTLDDLFMLHESVFPVFGVPQYATYIIYGVLTIGYLLVAWRVIVAKFPVLTLATLGMFGMSAGVDVIADGSFGQLTQFLKENTRIELLLDDGFKFLGIGFWLYLHLFAARDALMAAHTQLYDTAT